MTTVSRPVGLAHQDMGVHARLLAFECDVADERKHLDLLRDRNRLVVLARAVEVPDDEIAKGAYAGEVGRSELLLAREGGDSDHRVVALVEDEHEGRLVLRADRLRLHLFISLEAVRRPKRRL